MRPDQRNNFRVEWSWPATIYHDQFSRVCVLSNLSNGGAKLSGIMASTIPDEFMLHVIPHGRIRKCQVLWRTDDALRVEFIDQFTGAAAPTASRASEPTE